MKKTISLTVHDRPHYLRRVLHSLSRNNLRGYELFCRLEPGCNQCFSLCQSIDFVPCSIAVNERRLGVRDNPYHLLSDIFDHGSDFNLYLEDDVILSPDALDLANWFAAQGRESIICLCLLNGKSDPARPHAVTSGSFNALGVCLTEHAWRSYFQPAWYCDARGWDFGIASLLSSHPELAVWKPLLSRSNHIGRSGGTHCKADDHDRMFSHLAMSTRSTTECFELV